jgi:predicted methyltransferase
MQAVVDVLRIPTGAHVADVGAGTGLFLPSLAAAVGPSGRVYAVEPFPKFLDHLRARVEQMPKEMRERIVVQPSTDFDLGTGIPNGSLDFVLAIDTYHHFEYPDHIVRAIHAALKPTGRFVVLDFERIPGVSSEWVLGHVRANKETVIAEVEACGFVFEQNLKDVVKLEENYLLVFKKEQW